MIPTASNPIPSAPWVDAAAELLSAAGLRVDWLDLEQAVEDDVRRVLEPADVVFVAGGMPYGAENFVSIDDHQAVTVDGDNWRVIDSAPGLPRPGWSR